VHVQNVSVEAFVGGSHWDRFTYSCYSTTAASGPE
jgi:hypothetical protein